jgi:glycine cleavage system H protein
MAASGTVTVAGYELALDRRYDPDTNLWVAERARGRVRIGLDPLGAETMGDIVAVSFAEIGSCLEHGDAFATLEAAKFVGPIISPVRGTLVAANEDAIAAPGSLGADPLRVWLVELEHVEGADLERLLGEEEAIATWFTGAVERFREQGAIAE